jgi:hypothetical protein
VQQRRFGLLRIWLGGVDIDVERGQSIERD